MKEYNFPKLEKKLKKYMDEERFIHTQGVMYTACALAMCHNADMNQARLAGLLHDCAKCIPNSKKLKICQRENIPVSAAEEASPDLLHAFDPVPSMCCFVLHRSGAADRITRKTWNHFHKAPCTASVIHLFFLPYDPERSYLFSLFASLYILLVSAGNSQSFSSYFVTSISTFPSAKKEIPSASRSV